MSCYHPIQAFYRVDAVTKKKILAFPNCRDEIEDGRVWKDGAYCKIPIKIPCGMCVGCSLDYARMWSIRCMLELDPDKCNWFLTLTYDDDHLPVRECLQYDEDTGEVVDSKFVSSLEPDHLKKFMKDLRAYAKYHWNHDGIRFFACGEYGEKSGRAHYHVLLYNCPFPDVKLLKRSSSGYNLFESEILTKIWKNGFAVLGDLTFDSAAYTCRYVLKKQKGPAGRRYYEETGLEPEFTRCSRDPGIGREYFEEHKDHIYTYDCLCVVGSKGQTIEVKPPKYYDRLFEEVHFDEMQKIKNCRKDRAEARSSSVLLRTDLSEEMYLAVKEENQIAKLKFLYRCIE